MKYLCIIGHISVGTFDKIHDYEDPEFIRRIVKIFKFDSIKKINGVFNLIYDRLNLLINDQNSFIRWIPINVNGYVVDDFIEDSTLTNIYEDSFNNTDLFVRIAEYIQEKNRQELADSLPRGSD